MMDTILTWTQEKMGKEYLRDGKLQGIDAKETNAPQSFNINSLTQLINTGELFSAEAGNGFTGVKK